MLIPPKAFEGWEVTTVGDDIAWIKPNPRTASSTPSIPEYGFFGVAPGTNERPIRTPWPRCRANAIFTNTALTDDGDVWWEGLTDEPPEHADRLAGQRLDPRLRSSRGAPQLALHRAGRSSARRSIPDWENPKGVPISAMLFGGRVSKNFPLAFQSYNWEHGVYMAATMGSEATAAAIGQAAVRRDPMAMLPFCGYNMAEYWKHWLRIGRQHVATPPRIFRVNWFRKDEHGRFIWPGFGENMRVLKWIIDRCEGRASAIESPLGWLPGWDDLTWEGLEFKPETSSPS
jgi:phosphoenolpyruvate carboxykinase (GTP)